jgi:protein phosphatase 1 regulatory subunit 7
LTNLTELWLGKNKITKLEGLDTLVNLRLLSMQVRRAVLALPGVLLLIIAQSNRITVLEGLDKLVNLEDLYLSHNGITRIGGLEHNVRSFRYAALSVVTNARRKSCGRSTSATTGSNRSATSPISASLPSSGCVRAHAHRLVNLAEPDAHAQANGNKLTTFAEIEAQLVPLAKLETVYLEANPLQAELGTAYRRRLMLALPQVKQIDATCVRSPDADFS